MVGKLTKLAAGVLMTHYTRSKVDTGLLARITARRRRQRGAGRRGRGGEHRPARLRALGGRRACCAPCGDALCAAVRDVLQRFSGEIGGSCPRGSRWSTSPAAAVVAATEPALGEPVT